MKDGRYVPAFNLPRHLPRILLAVLLASAMLLATPPPPSHAQGEHITITPTSGAPGSTVAIDGSSFPQQFPVTIAMGGTTIADNVTVSTQGTFSVTRAVPLLPVGAKAVTATAAKGKISAPPATFNIIPHIQVAPSSGVVGSTVTITGSGFLASYPVLVTFGGDHVATVTTGANGAFSVSVRVPLLPPGERAVIGTASVYSATTSFVIPPPQITVKPESGVPGSTMIVAGGGFPAVSSVTITMDTSTLTSTRTNAEGAFSSSTTVPLLPPGGRMVTAMSGTVGRFA